LRSDGESVHLRRGSATDVAALEPIWLSIHHHHQRCMPQLAPYVDDAVSWASRSALYRRLIAHGDSVLMVAETPSRLVGYGLAHVTAVTDSWVLEDTWVTEPRMGEIESLGVRPGFRDRGIGDRLLRHLLEHLDEEGVSDVVIGMLAGNEAALRLYRRHGFEPTWLYASRFGARNA
jgi:ribosomal protein S18 acetylase RimI-like enzyme